MQLFVSGLGRFLVGRLLILLTVGVIASAISVIANTVVLGITLQSTFHIFGLDREARAAINITKKLAYNGANNHLTLNGMTKLIYI